MALDLYNLKDNTLLFELDENRCEDLGVIFETYRHWTGLTISAYSDQKLTIGNQQILIKIIDKYLEVNDLNKDRKLTSAIIEFKGLLNYFIFHEISLHLKGD
jgi:hypothetical protein